MKSQSLNVFYNILQKEQSFEIKGFLFMFQDKILLETVKLRRPHLVNKIKFSQNLQTMFYKKYIYVNGHKSVNKFV